MGRAREHWGATKHGKKRFKQRLKLPLRALRRMTAKALAEGLAPEDLPSPQREVVLSARRRHDVSEKAKVRVLGKHLFVFTETDSLVTVFDCQDLMAGKHPTPVRRKVVYPRPGGRVATYSERDPDA
jgi:hypothetical protein